MKRLTVDICSCGEDCRFFLTVTIDGGGSKIKICMSAYRVLRRQDKDAAFPAWCPLPDVPEEITYE
jgi:hypothetical protein